MKEQKSFQAETQELLNLMIHSLYSHKEVFLRELISNASDAIDRLKFESLTKPEMKKDMSENLEIRLAAEKDSLTIIDNGIGMNRQDVEENIGTIAKSGTKAWTQLSKEMKDNPDLIGQFGVGFYSAFMVADKIVLETKKAGEAKAIRWESDANSGQYSIEEFDKAECGTTIRLQLKSKPENADESYSDYSDSFVLSNLVKKYSDFIAYPIKMQVEEVSGEKDKEEKKIVDKTLNSQQALWTKSASQIKEEEYKDFYKHLTHDWNDPQKWIHFKAEGAMEFTALMYIPKQKPFDFDFRESAHGLSLYVRRVFIMNDCENLIPKYLRFVKGLVDSSDLSLNVSREILQQDQQVFKMQKSLTNKILSTFKDMLNKQREAYEEFWNNFGTSLKEGIALDFHNKEKLQDLFLFHSSEQDKRTTLAEYCERMKPEQKKIYFITGDNLSAIKNSPYLEKLKSKKYEVLLLDDQIDEWVTNSIQKYKDFELQSVMSDEFELEDSNEDKSKKEEVQEKYKGLLASMKDSLKDYVSEVRISKRLTDSPVCLVAEKANPSAHMERIMKAMGQDVGNTKRIMEINASHPIYEKMVKLPQEDQRDWTDILYSQALLNEGSPIKNPQDYAKKVAKLMLSVH